MCSRNGEKDGTLKNVKQAKYSVGDKPVGMAASKKRVDIKI